MVTRNIRTNQYVLCDDRNTVQTVSPDSVSRRCSRLFLQTNSLDCFSRLFILSWLLLQTVSPDYFYRLFLHTVSPDWCSILFLETCSRLFLQSVFPCCFSRLFLETVAPDCFSRLFLQTVGQDCLSSLFLHTVSPDFCSRLASQKCSFFLYYIRQ